MDTHCDLVNVCHKSDRLVIRYVCSTIYETFTRDMHGVVMA